MLTVAADGSCLGNPGPGGWAWVASDGRSECGADPATTNNRMELTATIEALRANAGPLRIVLDSQYVLDIVGGRLERWRAAGMRLANRKVPANRDLLEQLATELEHRSVEWRWVAGHGGHPLNEAADRLARETAASQ